MNTLNWVRCISLIALVPFAARAQAPRLSEVEVDGLTAHPQTSTIAHRLIRINGSFHFTNQAPVIGARFSVFAEENGGNPIWTEIQNVSPDKDGNYTAMLGSTQPEGIPVDLFMTMEPRWLEIEIEQIKQPRVLLVSVPYAMKAADADTLGGLPASAFLRASPSQSSSSNQTTATSSGAFTFSTSPLLNNAQPGCIGLFTNTTDLICAAITQSFFQNSPAVSIGAPATYYGAMTLVGNVPNGDAAGMALYNFGAGGGASVSLDMYNTPFNGGIPQAKIKAVDDGAYSDHLTFWTKSPGAGSNPIVERLRIASSGNIGIGTTTPSQKLDVAGIGRFTGGVMFGDGSTQTTAASGGASQWTTSGSNIFNSNYGNVGVGTSTPGQKLDVAGTGRFTGGIMFGDGTTQTTANPGCTGCSSQWISIGSGIYFGAGNVTIGSPGNNFPLDVNKPNGNSGTSVQISADSSSGPGNGIAGYNYKIDGSNLWQTLTDNNSSGSSQNAWHLQHDGVNANRFLTVQTGGNVGIGTTTPSQKLEVNGNLLVDGNITMSGSNISGMDGIPRLQTPNDQSQNASAGYGALQVVKFDPATRNGSGNTALGFEALFNNTAGYSNTAIGSTALVYATSSNNTAVGASALQNVTSGSENTAVGLDSGYNLISGSHNIYIGNRGTASDSGLIRIGTNGTQTQTFIAGISGVNVSGVPALVSSSGQLGVASSSRRFKQDIHDMADSTSNLMRLRPVTYRYRQPFEDGSQPLQYGLIAEEVDEVYPELVAHSADGEIETVKYQMLDSMLLNELQKQNATITAQKEEIRSLQERLSQLEAVIEKAGFR